MSSKTVSYMRWHHDNCMDDDVFCHLVGSPARKSFISNIHLLVMSQGMPDLGWQVPDSTRTKL